MKIYKVTYYVPIYVRKDIGKTHDTVEFTNKWIVDDLLLKAEINRQEYKVTVVDV